MTTLNACDITATDNYGMTYTYDQIVNNKGVQFYNATTKAAEDPKAPWTWVLVWEQNGAPLPADVGPLRLVAAQETDVNQVADGHLMVKWVNRVTLRGAVAEWKVKMYGLKRKNGTRQKYTLDRTTYDSCATPGCHGASWVQPDDEEDLERRAALPAASARWTAAPVTTATTPTTRRWRSGGTASSWCRPRASPRSSARARSATGPGIILANKLMGSDLVARYYPLRLVGPDQAGAGAVVHRADQQDLPAAQVTHPSSRSRR